MPIDTTLIGALHVEYLKKQDLGGNERPHHTLFQTSTIDALLEGKYDGDVSFAELEDRGDFGLGTLEALDEEMIALDGSFYQVKSDGRAYAIDGRVRTPFAVVTFFEPNLSETLATPLDFETFRARLDLLAGSLVGFRFPRYAQGLNAAGYHFHFITADRSAGGHVLEFRLARGELRVDSEADLRLELPPASTCPHPTRRWRRGRRWTASRVSSARP